MHLRGALYVFITALIVATGTIVLGQSSLVIVSDDDHDRQFPISDQLSLSILRDGNPDTLQISASNPFFDDFSYPGPYPDSSIWFAPQSRITTPQVNRNMAISPPSRGVVMFDGVSQDQSPYSIGISSGSSDQLISHYIDLSSHSPSENIFLSFFLQPQGRGNAPEPVDSFVVFFTTADSLIQVFSQLGSAQRPFQQFMIPVTDPDFFHTKFQIVFANYGARYGSLDHWHLDYVYLGLNRNAGDTVYQDVSPTGLSNSIIAPYTAIPVQHYAANKSYMDTFFVEVSNLAATTSTEAVTAEISDPQYGTPLAPIFTQQRNAFLAANSHTTTKFNPFGEQSFDQLASIQLNVSIPPGVDARPENNSFSETFRVDSIFAYDDGEPDAAYGLAKAQGFGNKVELSRADSLSAVWINFVPTVHINPVTVEATFMKGRSFRLVVWKDPHPDSLLLQQLGGVSIEYGDNPFEFQRYELSNPLAVPPVFWVGIQQIDDKSIGVGYDYNFKGNSIAYWDSLGNWTTVKTGGVFMIRPEMYNTKAVPAAIDDGKEWMFKPKLFPNPIDNNRVEIAIPQPNGSFIYQAKLFDLFGRLVHTFEQKGESTVKFEIPESIEMGMYIWRHELISPRRSPQIFMEKVMIYR